MSFHYILTCVVSIKKLPVNSIEDPLYIKNNFSLLLSRVSLCFWLLTVLFCVRVWKSLGFFYLECIKLLEYTGLWEAFGHIHFFKYYFCFSLSLLSSWDPHYEYVGVLYGVPQISEALFNFLHSFLSDLQIE